jgi:hypothetical protein
MSERTDPAPAADRICAGCNLPASESSVPRDPHAPEAGVIDLLHTDCYQDLIHVEQAGQ